MKKLVNMEKENIEKTGSPKKDKSKNDEDALQPCNTAPSAEHARAHAEDEPCDDGRAGISDS